MDQKKAIEQQNEPTVWPPLEEAENPYDQHISGNDPSSQRSAFSCDESQHVI